MTEIERLQKEIEALKLEVAYFQLRLKKEMDKKRDLLRPPLR